MAKKVSKSTPKSRMNPLQEAFGKILRERRLKLSITQEELAERAGLHFTYIAARFFVFLIQGLSRGVTTLSANLIESREFSIISKVLSSGVQITSFFSIGIFLLFWLYPAEVVKIFFNSADFERVLSYFETLKQTFFWGWMAFCLSQ